MAKLSSFRSQLIYTSTLNIKNDQVYNTTALMVVLYVTWHLISRE